MIHAVRTVIGDIDPASLGRTDYHEHLLFKSPLLQGEELDDVELSGRETKALREAGIDAVVELTPIGLGRDPVGLRTIAETTGMQIVMATGLHRDDQYRRDHPLRDLGVDALAARFVKELTEAVDTDDEGSGPSEEVQGVRAGVIKVGAGYWSISAFERRNLEAAAAAQRATEAAIVCHLEFGSAAWEVLNLLVAEGVSPDRVILAHADRNPDVGLHTELAAAGAYLGYDGPGRTKYWPDQVLIDCLIAVAEAGGSHRLLLGGDVARRSSFVSSGGMPGMAYLPQRFVPRIRQVGGDALVDELLISNPARAFTIISATLGD